MGKNVFMPKFLTKEMANQAIQIAEGRNSGGSNLETPVHLLYSGDTPYWGGDVIEGIVVTCSGGNHGLIN